MLDSTAGMKAAESAANAARVGFAQRYYVLAVLCLVTTVSILDRQIMGILVEPIRADLGLSDTQIGLLTGLAFSLVYVTAAFPIARLADTWSRIDVIAIAVSFWSVMTMLCGAAQNVIQMFMARFAVGIGEAGGGPPSHALVGDIFPKHERGTAMSIMMLCSPFGLAGGMSLGGWAAEHHGWRTAFYIAGAMGLLLGPLVFFTFPRVQRGMADGATAPPAQAPFFATIFRLFSIRTIPLMLAGAAMQAMLSMGLSNWIPAFLSRSHGMSPAEIGATLGVSLGVGSFVGHLLGGPLMDYLGRRDIRWHLWMAMIICPATAATAIAALVTPASAAIPLFGLQFLIAGLFSGPLVAILMNLAPSSARATASACMSLIVNLIGLGMGPLVVGWISELYRPAFGEGSLRAALLTATAVAVPATALFLFASRTYGADSAAADARNLAAGAPAPSH